MTTLLPPAKLQLSDANGVPLAGGSVYFYIPGTTTFKNTWQDSSQIALNTNPVVLDAAGEAVVFGLGAYRQVVYDSLGNLIWDQLTSSTDAGGIFSGGTSTGTAANQIVATTTPAGFSLTSGNQLTFVAGFSSTGATTLNANGTGAKNILKPGASGPIALVAGDIGVGDAVVAYYDGTQFQLVNPIALPLTGGTLSGPLNTAQGTDIASAGTINLTTATGNVVDVTGTTTITAVTLQQGATRRVRFTGILTLTNGASLVLPGAANITTAAGDYAEFTGYAAGVVRCSSYTKASGQAVIQSFTKKFTSSQTAIVSAAATTFAHSLGAAPFNLDFYLVCQTGEFGYTAGQVVKASTMSNAAVSGRGIALAADSTSIFATVGSDAAPFQIVNLSTGATASITLANWKYVVVGWL